MRSHVVFSALLISGLVRAADVAPGVPSALAPAGSATPSASSSKNSYFNERRRIATASIVANVNGSVISSRDIMREIYPMMTSYARQGASDEQIAAKREELTMNVRDALTEKYLILSDSAD